jgi:hypothetical protein
LVHVDVCAGGGARVGHATSVHHCTAGNEPVTGQYTQDPKLVMDQSRLKHEVHLPLRCGGRGVGLAHTHAHARTHPSKDWFTGSGSAKATRRGQPTGAGQATG